MNKDTLRTKIKTLVGYQQKFLDGDQGVKGAMQTLGDELIELIDDDESSIFDDLEEDIEHLELKTDNIENYLDILNTITLDEQTVIIIDFDESLTTPYYSAFINGLVKYQDDIDQDDVIFPKNIKILEELSYRSPITLLTRKEPTSVKESLKKVGLINRYNIIKIEREVSNLDNRIAIIDDILDKERYLDQIVLIDSKDEVLTHLHNKFKDRINGTLIKCSILEDLMGEIVSRLGQTEAQKLIQSRQHEYVSQLV